MPLPQFDLATINAFNKDTMAESMGIEYLEIGDGFIKAKMPVNNNTVQPMRLLHGGASVAFAETMGSVLGMLSLPDPTNHTVVGLEINANHIRGVKEGNWVYGKCALIHAGRTTMVCEIKITNDMDKLVCSSRITLAVVPINR
jgi:1,4-dihydroxy-2-naphthoyl-CoA hydrolase